MLRAFSNASASALLFRKTFDVYEYPRVRWRWKITKVYEKGDARKKSGDDYPVRIYINFLYDDDMATLVENILYKAAKAFYGEFPPLRSLNYVWANRAHGKRMLKSPYTSRTMLVILRSGPEGAGKWFTEEINILEDYRKAFGAEPPRMVNIAVMNDSDDTGESSTSYFDFIEVLK